jgi:hypothetical protein
MATHAVQPEGAVAESYAHTERIVFAIYMILGPLILLAATIIHRRTAFGSRAGQYYRRARHATQFTLHHCFSQRAF